MTETTPAPRRVGPASDGPHATRTERLDADLERELATVPDHEIFLGPDELTDRLRTLAARGHGTVRTLGLSRAGRPIDCLTVGAGARDAVVFGLPHAAMSADPAAAPTPSNACRRMASRRDSNPST